MQGALLTPPPLPQLKARLPQSGKSGWAIFGAQTFGSQTPPAPLPTLPWPPPPQLLAAMDGFDTSNNGVVVVAATNRYNLLDDALVRPGRFDRVVRVDLPTAPDREAILKVHLRNKNVDESLSAPGAVKRLADLTPNFSGAELAALTNEAAIRAVRRQGSAVNVRDMEQAILTYRASRSPAGGLLSDLLRG